MATSGVPIRAVLDTNVWISGIFFSRGVPARLLRRWRDEHYEIVITLAVIQELESVLQRKIVQFGAPNELAVEWLKYIETYAMSVPVETRFHGISRDAKDDFMLEAAVAGQAQYLVTGDKDLLVLGNFEDIQILMPRNFLNLLEQNV